MYFTGDAEATIKLSDGELRGGIGSYCVVPPSIHLNGRRYEWIVRLPDGPLPKIDPRDAGLLDGGGGETERTERTEQTERTEAHRENRANRATPNCSTLSVLSALSVSPDGLDGFVAEAIRSTLPSGPGNRNRKIFEFARALKAHPDLADAEPAALRDYVRAWHNRALPYIGTKPFDETWAEFVVAWPRVKFAKGTEPIALILKAADAAANPAWTTERYEAPETLRLVRLCRELQRAKGERPFFLSCRTVEALLGLDKVTVWRRLKALEADGVLKVAEPGTKKSATRYLYLKG